MCCCGCPQRSVGHSPWVLHLCWGAPGVTVLQQLLEFNKALEDSEVKAAFCIVLCGLCLSALFINVSTCTMNHVCTLWLFITAFSPFVLFKSFCYKMLNLTKSLSMFPRREPLNSLYIFFFILLAQICYQKHHL